MPRTTILSRVLDALANERRIIVADWRFHVVYMRLARAGGYALPDASKVSKLVKSLVGSGDIAPVEGITGVYRITTPYASILPSPQEAIIQEANPTAVFSHFTAAAYHDLTQQLPKAIHLCCFRNHVTRLPLGTTPEDWIDIPAPHHRTPKSIDATPIEWTRTRREWDFGHIVGYVQGTPVYVTDLERTLLDILRFPEKSGGPMEALRIWGSAADRIDIKKLVDYVIRFDQSLLRQRVGYLLEHYGKSHPILQEWASRSVRGSSAKLIASREFSPTFSERWNLSINVPDSFLGELSEN